MGGVFAGVGLAVLDRPVDLMSPAEPSFKASGRMQKRARKRDTLDSPHGGCYWILMWQWLRIAVLLFVAAFAVASVVQSAQAADIGSPALTSASQAMAMPGCERCKLDAGHHSGAASCDNWCLAQAVMPLPPVAPTPVAAGSTLEMLPFAGLDGPTRSPAPPPPRNYALI